MTWIFWGKCMKGLCQQGKFNPSRISLFHAHLPQDCLFLTSQSRALPPSFCFSCLLLWVLALSWYPGISADSYIKQFSPFASPNLSPITYSAKGPQLMGPTLLRVQWGLIINNNYKKVFVFSYIYLPALAALQDSERICVKKILFNHEVLYTFSQWWFIPTSPFYRWHNWSPERLKNLPKWLVVKIDFKPGL